jgi:hypothetical protein
MGLLDRIASFLRRRTFGTYNGESCGDLIALGQTQGAKAAILAFESALMQKWQQDGVELSDVEFDILAVRALEREVNNGGFRQFFFNDSRVFTEIIPLALRKIGCDKSLEAAENAIAIMGTTDAEKLRELTDYSVPHENDERLSRLNECDSTYYRCGEDVVGSLFNYVVENRQQIDLSAITLGSGSVETTPVRGLIRC